MCWAADATQDRLLSGLVYQTPSLLDTKISVPKSMFQINVPKFTESALARGIAFEHRQNTGRFFDQTEFFNLAESELTSMGCAIADLDQDGDCVDDLSDNFPLDWTQL